MRIKVFLSAASLMAISSLVLVFAACGGGDDSSSSSSGGSSGTGSDQQYVATVCKSMAKFQDGLTSATKDPSKLQSADDISKAFSKPFEQLLSDLKSANPPKDVKQYHDSVIAEFQKAVDSLKKGADLSSLSNMADLPSPPKDVQDRLQKIAATNDDCKKADVNFNQ